MPRANRHFLPGQLWHIAEGAYALREPRRAYSCDFGIKNDALRVRAKINSHFRRCGNECVVPHRQNPVLA